MSSRDHVGCRKKEMSLLKIIADNILQICIYTLIADSVFF